MLSESMSISSTSTWPFRGGEIPSDEASRNNIPAQYRPTQAGLTNSPLNLRVCARTRISSWSSSCPHSSSTTDSPKPVCLKNRKLTSKWLQCGMPNSAQSYGDDSAIDNGHHHRGHGPRCDQCAGPVAGQLRRAGLGLPNRSARSRCFWILPEGLRGMGVTTIFRGAL